MLLLLQSPSSASASVPARVVTADTVTTGTATGTSGNPWGGHQSRVVKTSAGIFTAYTTSGSDVNHRSWRLAWRYNGSWRVIASGPSGREPMALLAAPGGKIYVVAWPDPFSAPRVWSGTPNTSNGSISMSGPEVVPGPWIATAAPYQGAAIGADGAVYVSESLGVGGVPREFVWARRDPASGKWASHVLPTGDGRYTYPYLLPDPSGRGLTIVADRDSPWSEVGYRKPSSGSGSDYVFNRVRWWHTSDATAASPAFSSMIVVSEEPTSSYPEPYAMAEQSGALIDSGGRTHILYLRKGASTGGKTQIHHAIVVNGSRVDDRIIPNQNNGYVRIAANASGNLFIIGAAGGSSVNVWPVPNPASAAVGTPTLLNLGAGIEYAGLMPVSPRAGTPSSGDWDVGFPSGTNGATWRYARVQLPTP